MCCTFRRAQACLAATAAFSAPYAAHAAGLGPLTVLSALGQPLRAEIDIVSSPSEDLSPLQARLASQEAFQRAGIGYTSVLAALRFRIDRRADGHYLVEVRSTVPVNEPSVDMLVQLDSTSGPLIRRFVFLLDPVEYMARSRGARDDTRSFTDDAASPVPSEAAVTSIRDALAGDGRDSSALGSPGLRSSSDPTAMRALGLSSGTSARETPAAGPATPYRVKAGDTLGRIAELTRPQSVPVATMEEAIVAMNPAAFINKNRNLLRIDQVLSIPRLEGSAHFASTPLRAAPAAAIAAAASAASDAEDAELQAARSELAAMEEKVAQMREALRQVDEQIDRLQRTSPDPAPGTTPAQQPASRPATSAPVVLPQPVITKAPAAVSSPSFLGNLPDLPALPLAGAGLAMLAALGLWWYRRDRSTPVEASLTAASVEPQVDATATEEGPAVSANSLSRRSTDAHLTDVSTAGIGEIDTEDIDPIAEADVYIAYGRDAQAEEILKEALRQDSQRNAVTVKLLEIYAARKDRPAFNALATALHAATGGDGEDWERAAALGREIAPSNPRYRARGESRNAAPARAAATDPAAGGEASVPPTQPQHAVDHGDEKEQGVQAPELYVPTQRVHVPEREYEHVKPSIADPAQPEAAAGAASIDWNLEELPATEPSHLDLELPATAALERGAQDEGSRHAVGLGTKLQLAKAYRDLGDSQGARELLDQIVQKGNPSQREHAQRLLEKMES